MAEHTDSVLLLKAIPALRFGRTHGLSTRDCDNHQVPQQGEGTEIGVYTNALVWKGDCLLPAADGIGGPDIGEQVLAI